MFPTSLGFFESAQGKVLLILGCVLLLCSAGYGGARPRTQGPEPAGAEHYPAVYLIPVDTAEAARLERTPLCGPHGEKTDAHLPGYGLQFETPPSCTWPWCRWYRLDNCPLLANALPGATFYVTAPMQSTLVLVPAIRQLVARSDGRIYEIPQQVVQLLWDSGMRFTAADVQTWAPVLAILRVAVTRDLRENPNFRAVRDSILSGKRPYIRPIAIHGVDVEVATAQTVNEYSDAVPGQVASAIVHYSLNGGEDSLRISTRPVESHGKWFVFPNEVGTGLDLEPVQLDD